MRRTEVGVRGDAALQARMLLRGTGIAGAVVALGGGLALVGAYQPWHAVTAELSMRSDEQARPVAELAGWEAHPWGWLVPAVGLVTILLGTALVADRPPMRSRLLLFASAGALAGCAGLATMLPPEVNRFDVAGSRLRELSQLADRLPASVELSFSVGLGAGVWITLGGALLIAAGTLGARELP